MYRFMFNISWNVPLPLRSDLCTVFLAMIPYKIMALDDIGTGIIINEKITFMQKKTWK